MAQVRYPSLGIVDFLVYLRHVVAQLFQEVPLGILLKSLIILMLYLPLMLMEFFYDLQRSNPLLSLTIPQRVVIKLVRLAFAWFDYRVGKAFFSPAASLPLMKRRFGGKDAFNMYCAPVDIVVSHEPLQGYWLAPYGHADHLARGLPPPSLDTKEEKRWTLCYFHGGGFVMGSPTFYLEFLHKLRLTLAQSDSMRNAVIFVPVYPLAPDAHQPAQAEAARAVWAYLAAHPAVDTARMALGGDSAGGTIALGLRMAITTSVIQPEMSSYRNLPLPAQMILLSPFASLSEPLDQFSSYYYNAPYDFVDSASLSQYAQSVSGARSFLYRSNIAEFVGSKIRSILAQLHAPIPPSSPLTPTSFARLSSKSNAEEELKLRHNSLCQNSFLLSPGDYLHLFDSASSPCSTLVLYGKAEILADQAVSIGFLTDNETPRQGVDFISRPSVHVWPVVLFNLGKDEEERGSGLREISEWVVAHSRPAQGR